MHISRYPSLTEQQFLGCVAAFVDSLTGELNAALIALRRLEGAAKGSAFAYEMTLDHHRYGALIVLDRWLAVTEAFGPHLGHALAVDAPPRITSAEQMLGHVNRLIDAADSYSGELVEACALAFQSASGIFAAERASAEQNAKLGPMLPEDFTKAKRIFLEDLAAR